MALIKRKVKVTERKTKVIGYRCDCCKKDILADDIFEIQEMLHWGQRCGYGSIFGDENTVHIDLCQSCTNKLLGGYIVID